MTACPYCGGTGRLPCGDLEGKVEELRAACIVAGIVVSVTGTTRLTRYSTSPCRA